VFAFLNIVGYGMSGESSLEQNQSDMDSNITAHTALVNRDVIVGIKTAHYLGPDWLAVDRAIQAGELAQIPVMVDFGAFRAERPFEQLVTSKLRPGDISTHCYNMHIPMFDSQGQVLSYLRDAQDRGVVFDVGHGCASFSFRQAIPAVQQGFWPNSISTDLHTSSMLGGMQDMSNLMSKFLNMGMPLPEVVARTTWNPANEIHHPELGNLSVGASADVAILKVETGKFGFVDTDPTRMTGTKKIVNEMTLRDGAIVWDREGLAVHDWKPSNSPALHKQLVGK
jgi:dihydroorotase